MIFFFFFFFELGVCFKILAVFVSIWGCHMCFFTLSSDQSKWGKKKKCRNKKKKKTFFFLLQSVHYELGILKKKKNNSRIFKNSFSIFFFFFFFFVDSDLTLKGDSFLFFQTDFRKHLSAFWYFSFLCSILVNILKFFLFDKQIFQEIWQILNAKIIPSDFQFSWQSRFFLDL